MTRFAVVGAGGMLGRAWGRFLTEHKVDHHAFPRSELDITKRGDLERLGASFDVVVNCAAYTQVDRAETDEATASLCNGDAVGWLAQHCKSTATVLVHYSTDYVFDGNGQSPYLTTASTSPLNAYGRSKWLGEQHLKHEGVDALLIRTSWVYSHDGNNFVRTIANLLQSRSELRVVDDQVGRPSCADELASNSYRLLAANARGTFHLTDGGSCSWYEFATEIRRLLLASGKVNQLAIVHPCPANEYARPAPRPAYSVLDVSESEALLGPLKPWQVALAEVIARLPPT